MKQLCIAGVAVFLAVPALAQTGANPAEIREPGPPQLTTPFQGRQEVFEGSRSQVENSGPGATGTLARSGTGADNWSNDTANTSNSSDPERGLPNTGGGGGGDGQ
ncbi:hypothetical protein SAMN04487843_13235 [Methylobacterium sp. ap11]|uniref:hypothetical protein n=1 Tax=Methylobacterium sp. ap11 TaxID=1761799 RepID=UPI0008D35B98|nr:hypothetical protein [Methylobacterium sp. ap11]SEP49791.1 hypothetical protein SAMN04487843_13235 [Methylobacterium sp. ap11]